MFDKLIIQHPVVARLLMSVGIVIATVIYVVLSTLLVLAAS